MRIWILLACLMLLLGCAGEQPPAGENKSNGANKTNESPIKIISGEQKNQTILKNETKPPPPPEENKSMQYTYDPEQRFSIFFINVGGPALHGDAILLKKGDMDILVDAGPMQNGSKVVDFLRARGVDDIEVLISTNADPRHYGGIGTVADNYKIEEFWWNGETSDDPDYSALIKRMENESKAVKIVDAGFNADLNGINISVLNPSIAKKFDDVNNDAIVLRMADRNFSMLLTSGIQTGAQGMLINEIGSQVKARVMQAPYYGVGAGTSNIGIFLLSAKPETVIISGSSDESAQNGGSREPFKRIMAQYKIAYFENYKNGTIKVTSDGNEYAVMALGKGQ